MPDELRHPDAPPSRVAIVSLAKYPEVFEGLTENLNKFADNSIFDRVLVRDGFLIEKAYEWFVIDGPDKFNFSANVNLGLEKVDQNSDVFFISDDVRLIAPNSIEKLMELAYRDSSVGIVAPRVLGPADNMLQTDPPTDQGSLIISERYLVFVCLYIKRKVLHKNLFLDQQSFGGYGWDDVDYSRRVRQEGFQLAVTPEVEVQHGVHRKGTETFFKTEAGRWDALKKQNEHNAQVYLEKWGDDKKEWTQNEILGDRRGRIHR